MAKAIGLRVYLLTVAERGNPKETVSFNSSRLNQHFPSFISDFVTHNTTANNVDEAERTWFFNASEKSKELDVFGQISYGTYGFESNLKNNKTKAVSYKRKMSDIEEIPLYFQFWIPAGRSMCFVVFQAFQGKSCIQLVLDKLKGKFETLNSELILKRRKLGFVDKGYPLQD